MEWQDSIEEPVTKPFAEKVLDEGFKRLHPRSLRDFWALLVTGAVAGIAGVMLVTKGHQESAPDTAALDDSEMLEDLEILADLELLEDLEDIEQWDET